MRLNLDTGVVTEARFLPSPNCDDRPAGTDIDAIVIHSISLPPAEFGGGEVEAFFCNRLDISGHDYFQEIQHLQVSPHFFIPRHGGLVQFVSTNARAWHAGESELHSRCNVNDFSIGIELEGTDDQPFEEIQYQNLFELTRVLVAAYPEISLDNVVGHCDIAPHRKTDPGPHFDWIRYRSQLPDPQRNVCL